MKTKVYRCCICGKHQAGYGNNPWPVNTDTDARCCDICNFEVVIPERIKMHHEKVNERRAGDEK
ncbi:MAG: hypothetical protein Q4B26_03765 [Eubacteriales bacterium]|nr:hypothetical protein [Eubacteriales bacterium]